MLLHYFPQKKEYITTIDAIKEGIWLKSLLFDLLMIMLYFYDNEGAINLVETLCFMIEQSILMLKIIL